MKILEITNVDFSLRQFVLPLMRGMRDRGHEVVGVCADGPLLAVVRAEGFRVETVPLVRRLAPWANLRAWLALRRLIRAEAPDIIHAHAPISGFLARLAGWSLGHRRIAYTCHGYVFNQRGSLARRGLGLAVEWLGGRMTDVYLTVSRADAEDARRFGIFPTPVAIGNGRDPTQFRPDPAARASIRAELGVPAGRVVVIIVSRVVREKGYVELLAAMRAVDAELWVVGTRLPSDRGEDLAPYFAGAQAVRRMCRHGWRRRIFLCCRAISRRYRCR